MTPHDARGSGLAVNWFEGGRRITTLINGLIVTAGVGYVLFSSSSDIYFSTKFPGAPWYFDTTRCKAPSASEYLWGYSFNGKEKRSVSLCFRSDVNGLIPYKEVAPPADAPTVSILPPGGGSAPPLPKWYLYGESWNTPVVSYMLERKTAFQMTQDLERDARTGLRKLWWSEKARLVAEVAPFVGGGIFAVWVLSAAIGWLVRGFAGVPSGKDFRKSN